eukprot:g4181.t1
MSVRAIKQFHKRRTDLEKRRDDKRQSENSRRECGFMAFLIGRHVLSTAMATSEGKSKEGQSFLIQMLDLLETEMKEVTKLEADKTKRDAICEDMVLRVFQKADDLDRSGMFYDTSVPNWVNKCKGLARQFLIASQFFEVVRAECYETNEENEFPGDLEEKLKYSKLKTAEILRSLNDGVPPVSSGYEGSDETGSILSDTASLSESKNNDGKDESKLNSSVSGSSTTSNSSDAGIPIGRPPPIPSPNALKSSDGSSMDNNSSSSKQRGKTSTTNKNNFSSSSSTGTTLGINTNASADYRAAIKGVRIDSNIPSPSTVAADSGFQLPSFLAEASTVEDTVELAKFAIAALRPPNRSIDEAEKYLIAAIHALRKTKTKK